MAATDTDNTPSVTAYSRYDELPEWLTVEEWRTLVRIKKTAAYLALQAGAVPGASKIGGSWRIHRDSLLKKVAV